MDINEIFKYIGELYVQSKAEVASLRAEIARLHAVIEDLSVKGLSDGQTGADTISLNER